MVDKREKGRLFDEWPDQYDRWFTTPMGSLIKKYEGALITDSLGPQSGERILDAGCGTGIFTVDILRFGVHVVGLDISLPMLVHAKEKAQGVHFQTVLGDMVCLPFLENAFDRTVSVTALEFIEEGKRAVSELFRVTKKGGCIVVATLNSLSPWAARRKAEAKRKHTLFEKAIFRSPDELCSLAPVEGKIRTAIHFQKEDDPEKAAEIELEGRGNGLDTGAFLAVRWEKP